MSKIRLAYFLIILISAVLIVIWFKDGLLLSHAENALPFYKLSRYVDQTSYAWTSHPGLGNISLITTASKPTYFFLSFLQELGIPGFLIQAFVFWFFLVSAGMGIYLLTKEFFPKLPERYLLLSVFFYWFNPISLVDVWNRFLLNYMFFFASLPVLSFLFIKGLRTKNYLFGLILISAIGLYSFMFSYLAFIFLIWIIFGLFFLFFFLLEKSREFRLFYIRYFILILLLFLLSNLWWISQLFSFSSLFGFQASFQNLFNTDTNLGILDALSKKMGNLTDIFRLSNASFFNPESMAWVKPYLNPLNIAIEYIIIGIILYVFTKKYTDKNFFLLGCILFSVILLAKGSNPPLGEIYRFIFQKAHFLQVFRNPVEKFAFLQALIEAPLFSASLYYLLSNNLARYGRSLYIFFLLFIIIFWGFPFYTSWVFTTLEPPTNNYSIGFKVKVPQYYQQASDWLETHGGNFRFIGFPIAHEGITYIWERGYTGVDLSSTLFTTPGILFNTSVPIYYNLVPKIEKFLFEEKDFYKLANVLNVRFYMARHDIDTKRRNLLNPSDIEEKLDSKELMREAKKVGKFGELSFWENLKWFDATFYPATNIIDPSSTFNVADFARIDIASGDVLVRKENISLANNQNFKKPYISYQKINPAKYIVGVSGATTPFILVFSELFNANWQAIYSDKSVISNHFLANTYANGWEIEKVGDYDLSIEFIPQRWFETGEKISISTHILVGILLLGWKFKRSIS